MSNDNVEDSRKATATRPLKPSRAVNGTLKAVPHSRHSHFLIDPWSPKKQRTAERQKQT